MRLRRCYVPLCSRVDISHLNLAGCTTNCTVICRYCLGAMFPTFSHDDWSGANGS